jgi:cyanophycin synthetase
MVSHRIAHLLNLAGYATGLACGDAVLLDQRPIQTAARTRWARGQQILMNRTVDAAVIENDLHSILTEGLAYDRCQVGVVMDIDRSCTVPDFFIEDEDDLFKVLRTQVDVVLKGGAAVLDVDDPLIADMARLCDGEVIFFGIDPANPVLAAHLAAGGRAMLLQDATIMAATGDESVPAADLPPAVAAARNGEVAAHLAAAAAAWALGLPLDLIRTGLETFDPARPSGSRIR